MECLLCTDATTQQQGRIRASHDDETILTSLPTLHVQDLVVNDPLKKSCDDMYVEDSAKDVEELRAKEMDEDEELQVLMDFVLGPETEDEDSS